MVPTQRPPRKELRSSAKSTESGLTRQLEIIHVSDLHFGSNHQFDAEIGPDGKPLVGRGICSLFDKLREDVSAQMAHRLPANPSLPVKDPKAPPVILCVTGDFAEKGLYEEFQQAQCFMNRAVQLPGVGDRKSVFMVAGNHDVPYDQNDIGKRWQQYVNFFNQFYSTKIPNDDPWKMDAVYDRSDDLGVIVACINSSIYVQKGTADEQRGQVDEGQLVSLEKQLKKINKKDRDSAVRIALIHHHPILIPSLVEANRGYDAVIRSGQLLDLLGDYGFHLLLHGHKHHPHTFTEDIRNAFEKVNDNPMLVVAGGSVGSRGLPGPSGVNCYNHITIKWHPKAQQARIRVVTRGLITQDPKTKRRLLNGKWYWTTLREDDRSFTASSHIIKPKLKKEHTQPFDPKVKGKQEQRRKAEYAFTRRNMVVAEVRPSLVPNQAYEVTVWVVPHGRDKPGWEAPERVIWSAGDYFEVATVKRKDDDRFCATFDYWGPMLVQAEMVFADNTSALTHIYARIPES